MEGGLVKVRCCMALLGMEGLGPVRLGQVGLAFSWQGTAWSGRVSCGEVCTVGWVRFYCGVVMSCLALAGSVGALYGEEFHGEVLWSGVWSCAARSYFGREGRCKVMLCVAWCHPARRCIARNGTVVSCLALLCAAGRGE